MPEQTISTAAGNLTPYQIYSKVADNTTRNLIFAGIAAVVTWLFASIWTLGAKVLFWIGAVIWGLDAIHGVLGAVAGLVVLIGKRGEGESGWVWAAQLVRLLEILLCALLLYWLAGKLGVR